MLPTCGSNNIPKPHRNNLPSASTLQPHNNLPSTSTLQPHNNLPSTTLQPHNNLPSTSLDPSSGGQIGTKPKAEGCRRLSFLLDSLGIKPEPDSPLSAPLLDMDIRSPWHSITRPNTLPWVEIVEHPQSKGVRFRYECEGPLAGSLAGESSTTERKTVPSIKVHNFNGPAAIVVSCVTCEPPYQPHPHRLVSRVCKDGVYTLKIKNTSQSISFPQLGIQCVKKKDIGASLKEREQIQVDPFGTGYCPREHYRKLDLKSLRLCFQVFLDGPVFGHPTAQFVPLTPVITNPIHDRSIGTGLIIYKLSSASSPANGGKEIILLCDRVDKDDVQVRFFDTDDDEREVWEAPGQVVGLHKKVALTFIVPPYHDVAITEGKTVLLELKKVSTKETSPAIRFTYKPVDDKPRKRIRVESEGNSTEQAPSSADWTESGSGISHQFESRSLFHGRYPVTVTSSSRSRGDSASPPLKVSDKVEIYEKKGIKSDRMSWEMIRDNQYHQ